MSKYYPYDSREEHDMVNAVTCELVRIELSVRELRKVLDKYLKRTKRTVREEDNGLAKT